MSITKETAMEHLNDNAVTCCRFEEGTVIDESCLEDPNIVPDLEVSGLLTIPDNCLKIKEVLGATLTSTVEALTPLTADVLSGVKKSDSDDVKKQEPSKDIATATPSVDGTVAYSNNTGNQMVKIHIGEGKNINLEIPLTMTGMNTNTAVNESPVNVVEKSTQEPTCKEKIVRNLVRKYFKIDEVKFGETTEIKGTTLYLREGICADAIESEELVIDMKLDIITTDKYGEYSDTIMDVQPIATKEEGELGEGITRIADGVIMMVTGTDEDGVQIGEFGSSEGILERNIMWGRPGSPDRGEIFIKTNVTVKAGTGMERPGPMSAHRATDIITQEIREALKKLGDELVINTEEFVQKRRIGKKKVVVIKEIMGQGAMHDNYLMPVEPVGTLGAKANVDLGNVPVMVSPLQILDGYVHALTCIGPASKETSRHYFREPLVLEAMNDEEIDLVGVILVGSPQVNSEKFYVSKVLGMTVEALDLDGAIITTEGFGNNHVDFASHIEQIGKRGIAVVGMTYSAIQGQLVVGNKYMDAMVDLNKSKQGIENEILENNCITYEDALRAMCMLKVKMAGGKLKDPERAWNPNVKLNNIDVIEKATGKKIELAPNETTLEKSKKRREIYEVDEN
ncbi:D-proline reductase (dithiol) proprotein PrdA [Clostridiaceae bacterium M8S5]|nr:D-proline reductase (dithiol) proprotein PrdA [Clostridiaceae bacterium M8S5]